MKQNTFAVIYSEYDILRRKEVVRDIKYDSDPEYVIGRIAFFTNDHPDCVDMADQMRNDSPSVIQWLSEVKHGYAYSLSIYHLEWEENAS